MSASTVSQGGKLLVKLTIRSALERESAKLHNELILSHNAFAGGDTSVASKIVEIKEWRDAIEYELAQVDEEIRRLKY